MGVSASAAAAGELTRAALFVQEQETCTSAKYDTLGSLNEMSMTVQHTHPAAKVNYNSPHIHTSTYIQLLIFKQFTMLCVCMS